MDVVNRCTASGPHAAYNVSVVGTTSNSVTVTWYPAYDNGHDIHYVLWYVSCTSLGRFILIAACTPEDPFLTFRLLFRP